MTLTFGSLFAGIGGFDLGFERAGMRCLWQVEINDRCREVLAKHWPDVVRYEDVRECGKHNLEAVDVICGGFPCQPHSVAGKRRGAEDDRNLWPEYRRVIAELKPVWVVGENVPNIKNTMLDAVLSDLEDLNYTPVPLDIPAIAFGARHRRHRIFIVAHTNTKRLQGEQSARATQAQPRGSCHDLAYTRSANGQCASPIGEQWERYAGLESNAGQWTIEPAVGRVAHGVPDRVDRLKALGNAVVPQVAEWLGRRIVEVES